MKTFCCEKFEHLVLTCGQYEGNEDKRDIGRGISIDKKGKSMVVYWCDGNSFKDIPDDDFEEGFLDFELCPYCGNHLSKNTYNKTYDNRIIDGT